MVRATNLPFVYPTDSTGTRGPQPTCSQFASSWHRDCL